MKRSVMVLIAAGIIAVAVVLLHEGSTEQSAPARSEREAPPRAMMPAPIASAPQPQAPQQLLPSSAAPARTDLVELHGVVIDAGGGPIAGAKIDVESDDEDERFTGESDQTGAFVVRCPRGEVDVYAEAGGYATGVEEALAPGTVRISLVAGGTLAGIVVDRKKKPVPGIRVWLDEDHDSEFITDALGRFRIEDVAPGSYQLSAQSERLEGEIEHEVVLALGQTIDDLVIVVHPAFFVSGVVRSSHGEPCRGFFALDGPADPDFTRDAVEIEEGGRVKLTGIPPGKHEPSVECEGWDMLELPLIEVVDRDLSDLEWILDRGLAAHVTVIDHLGVGIPNAAAWAHPRPHGVPFDGRNEGGGRFTIFGLRPGAEYQFGASFEKRFTYRDITLQNEDLHLELTLEPPGTGEISGVVVDREGRPQSGLSVDARNGEAVQTDDRGRFSLRGLGVGPNFLDVRDRDRPLEVRGDSWRVELREGEKKEVELIVVRPGARVSGRVRDRDGLAVSDAFVSADLEASDPARTERAIIYARHGESVLTDLDGRFTLEALYDGRHIVIAKRTNGEEAIARNVRAGEDIVLVIEPGGTISGRVRGADPPMDVLVNAHCVERGLWANVELKRERTFRWNNLPPCNYHVTAKAEAGEAEAHVDLAAGTSADVMLSLQPSDRRPRAR